MIERCVCEKKTLTATFSYDALALADVVVVDVQCDYLKECLGDVRKGRADIAALEDSLAIIGAHINPDCLVLIETTVPPGTTEFVAYPIFKRAFAERGLQDSEPLLSHSYERVMPGREYVASIRDFWRVCSGINKTARALHVAGLVRDGLRNQSKIVAASRVLVLGASYREDVGNPAVIIDCFAMLSDTQIKTFFAAGYEVKGLGRGHMKRLKEEVAEK